MLNLSENVENANNKPSNDTPIVYRPISEFRKSGLLAFINTILHAFGWSIVCNIDKDGNETLLPARVVYRGFSEKSQENMYKNISTYLKENIDDLEKEANS